jgi:hypothetical protein
MSQPRIDRSCRLSARSSPDVCGFLAAEGFHGVACPIE